MSWADDMAAMLQEPRQTGRGLQLATMTGPTSLQLGDLALTAGDLLFASHLLTKTATQVSGQCPADGGTLGDTSTYAPALAAGDQVLVCQVSDSCFLVIERMVRAS